jgi:hypothetical protein
MHSFIHFEDSMAKIEKKKILKIPKKILFIYLFIIASLFIDSLF